MGTMAEGILHYSLYIIQYVLYLSWYVCVFLLNSDFKQKCKIQYFSISNIYEIYSHFSQLSTICNAKKIMDSYQPTFALSILFSPG